MAKVLKFYPKNSSMTKTEIAQWMNCEIEILTEEVECCDTDEDDYRPENEWAVGIKVVPKKISNKLAQDFTDAMYEHLAEGVDECEEEIVEGRTASIFKFIKRYK